MHNLNQIELLDSSPAAPRRPPPLLALEIVLEEGNELAFSTSLDTLTPRILAVFDKSIACTLVGLVMSCWAHKARQSHPLSLLRSVWCCLCKAVPVT